MNPFPLKPRVEIRSIVSVDFSTPPKGAKERARRLKQMQRAEAKRLANNLEHKQSENADDV